MVEKIAVDDEFLLEDVEEKVPQPQHAQASTSPLSLQFLRRIGMPDNVAQHIIGSAGQRGMQYYVGRANNPQQGLQQNPISAFFQGIGPANEYGGVGFNRFVHQFDRLFMGGAPGSPVNAEQAFQGLDFGALFGLGRTGSFGGQRLNPSDYGIGFMGLRDILGRLQREGGPRGPPPAAKKVVENLKEEKFSEDTKGQETACAICKDVFKQGDTVIKFPCPNKHLYHGACIQPWLKLHNSCPVCRFELATDDELYERMKEASEDDKKELSECQVFYLKMIGDYYRYLTEAFRNNADYKSKCNGYYGDAMELARSNLEATHPTRLGLALNYSVCHYEILEQKDDASYKDSTLIMQLLRDNLTIWNQTDEDAGAD